MSFRPVFRLHLLYLLITINLCFTTFLSILFVDLAKEFHKRSRMKKIVLLLLTLGLFFNAQGQTAADYTNEGKKLYEAREYMQAVINYNKALELDPDYYLAYYMRGTIKEAFEDIHGAMKDFNTAIEKNEKYAEAYFARGLIKYRLQDYYGAISDFTSTIKLDADNLKAYFKRGQAKQQLEAYQDAINDCTKILQIKPNNVDAYFLRGILRLEFGQLQEGCLDLSKAGELGDLKAYDVIRDRCNQRIYSTSDKK